MCERAFKYLEDKNLLLKGMHRIRDMAGNNKYKWNI